MTDGCRRRVVGSSIRKSSELPTDSAEDRKRSNLMKKRTSAFIALALIVPAPSLGVYMGMIAVPDTGLGQLCFLLSKIWLFAFPLVWLLFVQKGRMSMSLPRKGGLGVGAVIGMIIGLLIMGAYLFVGRRLIDPVSVRESILGIGLSSPAIYVAGALYWILINSVLEEYVWRWFVTEKCSVLFPGAFGIVLSSFAFTLHHIVALQVHFNWLVALIASVGVFIGGVIWSWCYIHYRSIWPGYVSHALVDVAVFVIGYNLAFCQ